MSGPRFIQRSGYSRTAPNTDFTAQFCSKGVPLQEEDPQDIHNDAESERKLWTDLRRNGSRFHQGKQNAVKSVLKKLRADVVLFQIIRFEKGSL
jgi:hypothetical protein